MVVKTKRSKANNYTQAEAQFLAEQIVAKTRTVPKSFADCIFEITNSSMDQATKTMAFDALKAASNNMVFRNY